MNSLISGALALALPIPNVAVAQERYELNEQSEGSQSNQPSTSKQQSGKAYKFSKGERFERSHAQNYSRIDHRSYSSLSAAPRGYTWVRAGNDALLVRLSNNVVRRVVDGVFDQQRSTRRNRAGRVLKLMFLG